MTMRMIDLWRIENNCLMRWPEMRCILMEAIRHNAPILAQLGQWPSEWGCPIKIIERLIPSPLDEKERVYFNPILIYAFGCLPVEKSGLAARIFRGPTFADLSIMKKDLCLSEKDFCETETAMWLAHNGYSLDWGSKPLLFKMEWHLVWVNNFVSSGVQSAMKTAQYRFHPELRYGDLENKVKGASFNP